MGFWNEIKNLFGEGGKKSVCDELNVFHESRPGMGFSYSVRVVVCLALGSDPVVVGGLSFPGVSWRCA